MGVFQAIGIFGLRLFIDSHEKLARSEIALDYEPEGESGLRPCAEFELSYMERTWSEGKPLPDLGMSCMLGSPQNSCSVDWKVVPFGDGDVRLRK